MFARKRRAGTTAGAVNQAGAPLTGYHVEVVLVGDPDVLNRARVARVFGENNAGMAGQAGTAIGYDRGDPARTLTGWAGAAPSPLAAQARLGSPTSQLTVPTAGTYSTSPTETTTGYLGVLARRTSR